MSTSCSVKPGKKNNFINHILLLSKLLITLLFIIPGSSPFLHAQGPQQNILILHSYHSSFSWNVEINAGIKDVLNKELDHYNLILEYMDSKRIFDQEYQNHLFEILLHKHQHSTFDVIIATDDDALDFLSLKGEKLFEKTPVVFCGINNLKPHIMEQFPHYTGVLEELSMEVTLDHALSLFPETQKVFFLGDNSTSSHDLTHIFQAQVEEKFPGTTFSYLHDSNMGFVIEHVKALPPNSLLMLWPFLQINGSILADVSQGVEMITSASTAPSFGFWEFALGHGIIGGKLVSGYVQGEKAAELAVKILQGHPPENLPLIEKVENQLFFDYQQLKKHGVSISQIPAESIIVNKPKNFFQEYLLYFYLLAIFLLTFGILLLANLLHSNRVKKILKSELSFQQELMDALPNPVFYCFDCKILKGCNQAFEKFTGYNRQEITNKSLPPIYPPSQAEQHMAINREVTITHRPATYEGKLIVAGNRIRDVIFYKSPIYNKRTKQYGVIETIVDITEKKLANEKIRQSEERYALATNATKDGIWDWNLKQKKIFMSDRLKQILGYQPHEDPIVENNIEGFIHPNDYNIIKHQTELLKHQVKESFNIEIRLKKKNHDYIWTEFNVYGVTDENKNTFRMVGSVSDIELRKKTEQTLKKWEDIFQNTRMGMVISLPNNPKMELMNPVFAQMHGYTRQEIQGRPIDVVFPPGEKDKIPGFIRNANDQGHYMVESLNQHKDGNIFPVMLDITSVRDNKDKLQYHIVNVQDISERKKQEETINQMLHNEQSLNEELRSSEEELKQMLEQTVIYKEELEVYQQQLLNFINGSSDFVILKDNSLKYIMVNNAFAEYHSKKPEDFKGKTDFEITHLETAVKEQEVDKRVLKTNKMIIYESNSGVKIFETRKFPVSLDKNTIGVGAFIRDITHQKTIEQQVYKNEQRLKTLLENSFDLITITDQYGLITYCTQALEKITGLTMDKALGKQITDWIYKEDIKLFNQQFEDVLQSPKTPVHIKHRVMHPTEGLKNIETIAINHLKNPLIKAIVFTSRDVSTEMKSQQLKKNIALAQKSAEIKQQFLANMSHEIRTPMNGIIGIIEFLTKTNLDKEQKDYVETIKSSADSLLNIINDILDFSKIEAGKLSIRKEPVNIQKFSEETHHIFASLVKQKNLNFNVFTENTIPQYLELDAFRVRQVLTNLLSNAIKFTQEGRIELKIVTQKMDDENVILKFEVHDTGIGITQKQQQKLFIAFSQIDSSLTRTQEGSGLGLAISQRMVELMGGEIGVKSQFGEGSVFWFTIKANIPEHEKVKQFVDAQKEIETHNLHLNILLVEDKVVNQKVIKLMVESWACKITLAENGQKALDILEKHNQDQPGKAAFDIILMDIQMPVMDGITATRVIREQYPQYPVIIGLSANVIASDVESFLQNGLDDYIVKPAKSKEIFKKLLYWKEQSRKKEKETPVTNKIIEQLHNYETMDPAILNVIHKQSKDTQVLKELFSGFYYDVNDIISHLENLPDDDSKTLGSYLSTLQSIAQSMGALQISRACEIWVENNPKTLLPKKQMVDFLRKANEKYQQQIRQTYFNA